MNKFLEQVFETFKGEMLEKFDASTTLDGFSTKLPRPHIVRRMPFGDKRWYHTVAEGKPRLMTGISAVVDRIAEIKAEKGFLQEWKILTGKEASQKIAHETSVLGTFMHILCSQVAQSYAKGEDIVLFDAEFQNYFVKAMESQGVAHAEIPGFYKRANKGIKSFHNFLVEYNVEVLAIEKVVCDFDHNIATPLDIVCYADIPGRTPKYPTTRSLCNFNIKFRESATSYESDRFQVCAEQYIYNKYIAPITGEPIERTFILIPKSHSTAKTECLIKEYTTAFSMSEWERYLAFMKQEMCDHHLFFPDLEAHRTFTERFIISGTAIKTEKPISIKNFILSFYEDLIG